MAEYIIQSLDRNDFMNFIKVWQQKKYKTNQNTLYIGICFNNKSKVGITQFKRIKKREKEWKAILQIDFIKVWVTNGIQTIFLEQFIHKLFASLGLHYVCNESKEIFNVEPEHCIKMIDILLHVMEKTEFNKKNFVKMLMELKTNKMLNDIQIENNSTANIQKTYYKTVPKANNPIPTIFGESQLKSWKIETTPRKINKTDNTDIVIEILQNDPNQTVYITRTGKYYHKNETCGEYKINIKSTLENAINKNFKKCIYCYNEQKMLPYDPPKQTDPIKKTIINNDNNRSFPLLVSQVSNNLTGCFRKMVNCMLALIPLRLKKFFKRFLYCYF